MKYIFGPVNSRRLGLSLGIDLIPAKVCNFDCIYCEIGKKTIFTDKRTDYSPADEIIAELTDFFENKATGIPFDVITITASGEPTLHSGCGRIIRFIKSRSDKPVAVLTNGSFLHQKEVREDLMAADIVIPSLDAVTESSFRKINRPLKNTDLAEIISGIGLFSREFPGKIWLEILFVRGINDSSHEITAFKDKIASFRLDKIQLNTVLRPPLESFARPIETAGIEEIAGRLGDKCEIVADFVTRGRKPFSGANEHDIVEMLTRRPCTAQDISQALHFDRGQVEVYLKKLEGGGSISATSHRGEIYYQVRT